MRSRQVLLAVLTVFALLGACSSSSEQANVPTAEPSSVDAGPSLVEADDTRLATRAPCVEITPGADALSATLATGVCLSQHLSRSEQECAVARMAALIADAEPVEQEQGVDEPDITVSNPAALPATLVDDIASVAGVTAATGHVAAFGVLLLDEDGDPVGLDYDGPALLVDWPSFNSSRIVRGKAPVAPGEIAVSEEVSTLGQFEIGQRYEVLAPGGKETFELVGIFSVPRVGGMLSAMSLEEAVRFGTGGGYSSIEVRAEGSLDSVVSAIEELIDSQQLEADIVIVSEVRADLEDSLQKGREAIFGSLGVIMCVTDDEQSKFASGLADSSVDAEQADCMLDRVAKDLYIAPLALDECL